ncbi:hypothetical protein LEP1GSC121_4095 [Leptospira borgpetersenii serovar Castellonis str. 200801910]|uniref:Uncharacterized protein n=2 Tax=Leptospira borgpetersenii TaxID=174 RepID=A0A0S2IR01_LEPBO|nr:hypothetical protein LBBP_01790 [Leptospira borgpetersenii serovar Ballum]EKR02003.1 hypothetical protein LEP1GSC121_4095 [Leptospira borgpetersenii serovar Castellonis str. 200801910]EMK13257.1 hypothetical protein LEP1GSC066_3922 [Leptospira sp. serovar Kenya str. Sh9]EMN12125.1 hypothetical protein LEP1GSC055_4109 [Leptospira borgpetersenii str. Brem 307]EMN15959.1 hypothetical protein LEP1GSC056_0845 [Leptospira borgpetersenii str. Brem 328]
MRMKLRIKLISKKRKKISIIPVRNDFISYLEIASKVIT